MRKYALALCLPHDHAGITALQAQTPTATLSGIVKDAHGALVQGARVALTNVAQGTVRESVSNAEGSYSIPDLSPGTYRADVSAAGFTTVQFSNVVLEAGRTFTLDATLLARPNQVTTVNVTGGCVADRGSGAVDDSGTDYSEYD